MLLYLLIVSLPFNVNVSGIEMEFLHGCGRCLVTQFFLTRLIEYEFLCRVLDSLKLAKQTSKAFSTADGRQQTIVAAVSLAVIHVRDGRLSTIVLVHRPQESDKKKGWLWPCIQKTFG